MARGTTTSRSRSTPAAFTAGNYPVRGTAAQLFSYFLRVHLGGRGDFRCFPHDVSYTLRRVRLSKLVTSVALDNATAQAYAARTTPFPPIILRNGDRLPLDGRHRVAAARIRGAQTLRAYVSIFRRERGA